MKKLKIIVLLFAVFVLTILLAIHYENSYRALVRYFFKFFQGDKIKFFGKNFHLFASPYFVVAFGLFSVLFAIFFYGQSKKGRIVYSALAIILFLITTIGTAYVDSTDKVAECTACSDGVRSLHYNDVNYDFHFITSLAFALFPLLWAFLKKQRSKKRQRMRA